MRQSIILPDRLENLLVFEAEKCGLVKLYYNFADELYSGSDLDALDINFKQMMESRFDDRQNLFRMLLLFDEVILSSVTQNYDYNKLKQTGMFSVYYLEDEINSDPMHQECHIEYAKYLKPAILPVFERSICSYFKYGQAVGGFTEFISDLYDCILLCKHIPEKHLSFIEFNKLLFDIKNNQSITKLTSEFGELPEILTSKRFFADISGFLCVLYESLCWQLEISSDKEAAIIDSDFKLANIGCRSLSEDFDDSMEAYGILRVECEKLIGELPRINSIQEVFQLKEKRHHDIHNLKQELSRLENEIRCGGTKKAIEKAAIDIAKASKSLSKGVEVSRITKWTNFLSIPVSMISLFCGKPQIAIGAGIISIVGQTSSFIESSIKDKNKWFEIVF